MPLVRRGDELLSLPRYGSNIPLGVEHDIEFRGRGYRVFLQPGDLILLYTDGVRETEDAMGRLFGLGGIRRALLESAGTPPQETVEMILDRVEAHRASAEPQDDYTLLAIAPD